MFIEYLLLAVFFADSSITLAVCLVLKILSVLRLFHGLLLNLLSELKTNLHILILWHLLFEFVDGLLNVSSSIFNYVVVRLVGDELFIFQCYHCDFGS